MTTKTEQGTEYRETKADREDAFQILRFRSAISTARQVLDLTSNPEGDPTIGSGLIREAAEKTIRNIENQVEVIETQMANRRTDFYSDRNRIKRALNALRKDGFAASVSEPSYESISEHSFPIAEAVQNNLPFVYVSRDRWAYAFETRQGRFDRKGDTLLNDLYINWGPSENESDATWGRAIVRALEAEGLKVEWDGTTARTVTVKAAE